PALRGVPGAGTGGIPPGLLPLVHLRRNRPPRGPALRRRAPPPTGVRAPRPPHPDRRHPPVGPGKECRMTSTNPLFRRAPAPVPAGPNPFERYGLRQNPFPNLPGVVPDNDDPRVNGSIYRADLRKAEQDKFERLLVPTPAHPDVSTMAFLMDCATRF